MSEQQLPEGWQMVKFGDIAKHISKRVEPSETDLEVYVGLEHLDPDSLKIKRHGVPSDVAGQKLLVKKGQIIFGKRRAYQRKVAVADWDCICSAHAMVLEANPEKVIPEFLPFVMQSDVFMKRAVEISEGSLSPTIKWKVLSNQLFAIPDIRNQQKLLSTLNSLEHTIARAYEAEQSSLNLFQRIIDKLTTFDRIEDLPAAYKRVRLKEIGKTNSALLSNKTKKDSILEYIDISSVSFPGKVNPPQEYTFAEAPSRARRILNEGDIVVSTVRPNHRASFYVSDELKGKIASTGFSIIATDKEYSDFAYFFTLSKQFSHSLTNLAVGTSFPAVTDADVLSQRIVLPPKNELKKQVETLKKLESNYRQCHSRLRSVINLKSNYLNTLLGAK
ncbi:restriction endonuclease subunit S [Aestuariirhabdus sp. Z084]|uniref:restriction endonuclease subunit S n=1 Tax=Aestuariirhabdus haliotis TaxID=2918751 RepID=UPI0020BED770|nr:restriction endonuclease subunit S [Aestuariirhabdus haliotis]MCL6417033.1 restriction endonuclease subunit S [Aestuariirhabdus haliotis]